MTKKLLFVFLALVLCLSLSVTVFAQDGMPRLVDSADLLTDSEEISLQKRIDEVSEKFKVEIDIVTVETVGDYTADEFVEDFYDENNYGYGENRDGVLLLVAMEEGDYRILSNGLGADAISSGDIDDISNTISSYLTDGDYADAFNLFIDECEYEINGEINGFPFKFTRNLVISLVIGLVVALIVTGSMKSQLKSVRRQPAATEYTKPGSMQVTYSKDFFLYRIVDRQKKENNSSGSSGSSRNVGGGKF